MIITSFAATKKSATGFAFSPLILTAIPNITENTNKAITLSFESNFEKSFTDINVTVLSSIEISSVSCCSSVASSEALICSPSSGSTNLIKYVLKKPIKTAKIEISRKTTIIVIITFPNLFGCLILAIDVVMFKKISGTITTSNRFKNKSPKGLNMAAFSWNTIPTIAPTIIATKRIIVDL